MSKPTGLNEPPRRLTISRILTSFLGLALFSAVWFWIAGRANWWQGWAFLLAFIVYVSVLVWRLSRVNPELVRERDRPAGVAETWDRAVIRVYSVILIVFLVVSALDGGRYGWSVVPLGVQVTGWISLVAAGAIVWHAMMVNAYLSSWARLQKDRGQVVVQEGMYRHIRHPMYLGIMIAFLGLPLVLGSWWAMIPSVVIIGLFLYRTYREDEMLMEELAGYAEYAKKVKYKLLPGLW